MAVTAKPLEDLLLEVEDRTFESVWAWKERTGRPVIGCFPVYAPVEIFHAAGMLPFGLFGGGVAVEITHADSRFQSFVCSIAKSTLELGLNGKLDRVDGLLFSSICDVARNLSSVFVRNFPGLYVEYMHLPQNPPGEAVLDYTTAELNRIRDKVERHFRVEVTDDALRESLRLYNRLRGALRELYAQRTEHPERFPAREVATITRATTFLPPQEGERLVQEYLEEAVRREERVKDRIRVIIEGSFCEQPSVELIQTLEEAGCYIVDDDLVAGWRFFDEDVPLEGDPIRNLAESLLLRSRHTSVRLDVSRPRTGRLVEKVRRLKADAVIIMPAKFCEPALFDYVLFREALEKEGIPHLFVEFEEKMWTFERLRNEVETFVESMLFD
jgi:benzoyl-CoA reductase subunit C